MSEGLPTFKYHPEPVSTGAVERSDTQCVCCNQARGFVYRGPVYSVEELDSQLCPWCVADGSAARRFNAEFVDAMTFDQSDLDPAIIEEVTRRTPSYVAWQQEQWLTHCSDACEYHGYPSPTELNAASSATIKHWAETNDLTEDDWDNTVTAFANDAGAGFYKFVCRKCDLTLYASDWD